VDSPLLWYNLHMTDEDTFKSNWYHLTPDRLVLWLLAVEACLLLINRDSGRMVLAAVAITCLTILGGLVWFVISVFRQWRFQFGIRTLLLLIFAVAVCCSWFACRMQKAKRQKEVVEEILGLGGGVEYDYHFDSLGNRIALPFPKPPGPAWLRKVVGVDFLSNVVYVRLYGPSVTDARTQNLPKLSDLRTLRLTNTRVTFKRYRELQEELPDCKVSATYDRPVRLR